MAGLVMHGFAASSGIAVGKAFFLNKKPGPVRRDLVPPFQVEIEIRRFEEAVAAVVQELEAALAVVPSDLDGHCDLIESHLLICQDPKLRQETVRHIEEQRMNAEWALEESLELIAAAFKQMDSPYIRERVQDIRLVCGKILQNLRGVVSAIPPRGENPILLAHDISPAEALALFNSPVAAFVTDQGGVTSHSGMIARSLGIPAVVGVRGLEEEALEGDLVIVDGFSGRVIIAPDTEEIDRYRNRAEQFAVFHKKLADTAGLPAETEDGKRISVVANIDVSSEAAAVLEAGGEGAGLVRTEFGYISYGALPDEETLYTEYSRLAALFAPRPVVFRTLDVGADKLFNERRELDEENPALGLRAVRFCMRHQDIFRRQIRAILRASAHGSLALMFPLISGVEELRQARSILNEARQELDAENIPFDRNIPVGIMVELPSAVLMADVLAREVDFFSIGTNDLIQYTLGADRSNRNVAYLHQPLNPAILRSIKNVVDTAHEAGISVSVCGEMAADPYCIPLLLGMPVDSLSVSAQSIPLVKHIVRRNNMHECRKLLATAFSTTTGRNIRGMVLEQAYTRYAEDIPFFPSGQAHK